MIKEKWKERMPRQITQYLNLNDLFKNIIICVTITRIHNKKIIIFILLKN